MTLLRRVLVCCLWFIGLCSYASPSWTTQLPGVSFSKGSGAYGDFYLIANGQLLPDYDKAYALTRMADPSQNKKDGTFAIPVPVGLIKPTLAYVNEESGSVVHPMYGKEINDITMFEHEPLMRYDSRDLALIPYVAYQYKKGGFLDTSRLLINDRLLVDAHGAAAGSVGCFSAGAVTLAKDTKSSSETKADEKDESASIKNYVRGQVFAAVTRNASSSFEGESGDGICLLHITNAGLKVKEASQITKSMIQIGSRGTITGVSSLYWDTQLQRLYVGLSITGGGVGVLVGRVEGQSLVFEPIISATDGSNSSSIWDTKDYVVAQNASASLSFPHMKVMHTSTNQSYLIVVGGTQSGETVTAVPLVRSAVSGDGAHAHNVGKLAQKDNLLLRAESGKPEQLLVDGSDASLVGSHDVVDRITDLKVVGDTVFASVAGATSEERGIFQSTALFDENGVITRWSKWSRVMGAADNVYSFSLSTTGIFLYLTGASATNKDSVAVSGVPSLLSFLFLETLASIFPLQEGGATVAQTFGYADTGLSSMDLAVIGGGTTVAVANMGTTRSPKIEAGDVEVKSYDLSAIGHVTTAGFSATKHRLYVGGQHGVAVLSDTSGDGFSSGATTLDPDASFKKISDLAYVRALCTDSSQGYVLTLDGLYAFSLSDHTFASVPLATPAVMCGSAKHSFLGLKMVGNYAFLATTAGLFVQESTTLKDVTNTKGVGGWREVYLDTSVTPHVGFGICADMSFIAAGDASLGGVLYLLSTDISLNTAMLYRVTVSSSDLTSATILPIIKTTESGTCSYMSIFQDIREHCFIDGAFMYSTASSHHSFDVYGDLSSEPENNHLRLTPVNEKMSDMQYVEKLSCNLYFRSAANIGPSDAGKVARDPASGALLVPGRWVVGVL